MQTFEENPGYRFRDPALFTRALTRKRFRMRSGSRAGSTMTRRSSAPHSNFREWVISILIALEFCIAIWQILR